jgi:hypothetical protein
LVSNLIMLITFNEEDGTGNGIYTSSECLILPLIEPTPYVRSYREICLLCSTHDPCYVHPRDMSVYMFKGSRFLSAVNAQKSEAA